MKLGNTTSWIRLLICGHHLNERTSRQSRALNHDESGLTSSINNLSHSSKIRSRYPECYRCGYEGHDHNDPKCPARNRECKKCGKFGHFAKKCKTDVINKFNKSSFKCPNDNYSGNFQSNKKFKSGRIRHIEDDDEDQEDNLMMIQKN